MYRLQVWAISRLLKFLTPVYFKLLAKEETNRKRRLTKEQEEIARKIQAERDLRTAKIRQVLQTRHTPDEIIRIEKCDHLKGGRRKPRGLGRDYNVMTHTHINGATVIRCGNCGREWTQTDPDWSDGLVMAERSSNTPTSSEVPLGILDHRSNVYTSHSRLVPAGAPYFDVKGKESIAIEAINLYDVDGEISDLNTADENPIKGISAKIIKKFEDAQKEREAKSGPDSLS